MRWGLPLTPWGAEILSAVSTYTERSPSGGGLKLYFYAASEDVRPFLERIGVQSDAWGARRSVPGQDGRAHGPAIEVYFAGRFFAVRRQQILEGRLMRSFLHRRASRRETQEPGCKGKSLRQAFHLIGS